MAEEISPLEDHGWWMERLRKDAKANRPEALRLADWCKTWNTQQHDKAAAELRRLHALNGELLEALKLAVRQNDYDMLMTGEELRDAAAAIKKAEGKV
jgi:hypothetical protein